MYKLFTFKYVILIHDKYFICLYDRYKKPFKPYNNMITDERPKLRRREREKREVYLKIARVHKNINAVMKIGIL